MSWLARIKNYLYQRAVANVAIPETVRKIVNFEQIQTACIVADLSLPENEWVIMQLSEELIKQGKTVYILGYVNDKDATPKEGVTILTPKEINWYNVPNEEVISFFVNEPFDVLFCPFFQQNKALNYIAAVAQAQCRMGIYSKSGTNNYELMVQLNEDTALADITAQMLRLLQQIKTKTK